MPQIPSALIFINGDISYPVPPIPQPPPFIGQDVQDYIGFSPSGGPDPNNSILNSLRIQLFLDDVITYSEFLLRMSVDPDYNVRIHLNGLRVLVIVPLLHQLPHHHDHFEEEQHLVSIDGYCPPFHDGYHRDLADIILFYHLGLIDVEYNRLGPKASFDYQRITIYQLLHAARSNDGCCNLPFDFPGFNGGCEECGSQFYCDRCHTFSGLPTCRGCQCECRCFCNIHLPNCDRELNNWAFIHRK